MGDGSRGLHDDRRRIRRCHRRDARANATLYRRHGGLRRAPCADIAHTPAAIRVLDRPRGTTRAFFDVEFETTGWTSLANVTGWAAISFRWAALDDGPADRRAAHGAGRDGPSAARCPTRSRRAMGSTSSAGVDRVRSTATNSNRRAPNSCVQYHRRHLGGVMHARARPRAGAAARESPSRVSQSWLRQH